MSRMCSIGTRLCPPASTRAMPRCSSSIRTASSTDAGRRYSNGAAFTSPPPPPVMNLARTRSTPRLPVPATGLAGRELQTVSGRTCSTRTAPPWSTAHSMSCGARRWRSMCFASSARRPISSSPRHDASRRSSSTSASTTVPDAGSKRCSCSLLGDLAAQQLERDLVDPVAVGRDVARHDPLAQPPAALDDDLRAVAGHRVEREHDAGGARGHHGLDADAHPRVGDPAPAPAAPGR